MVPEGSSQRAVLLLAFSYWPERVLPSLAERIATVSLHSCHPNSIGHPSPIPICIGDPILLSPSIGWYVLCSVPLVLGSIFVLCVLLCPCPFLYAHWSDRPSQKRGAAAWLVHPLFQFILACPPPI